MVTMTVDDKGDEPVGIREGYGDWFNFTSRAHSATIKNSLAFACRNESFSGVAAFKTRAASQ